MKAGNALIMWNAPTMRFDRDGSAPPGSVAIGPLEHEGCYWSDVHHYENSGGAAWVRRRTMLAAEQEREVMLEFYQLVYTYAIDPYLTHRAFLLLDEYQDIIKRMACGPAKGELGHDPEVGYGRAVIVPTPEIRIIETGPATHFWPV